MNRIWQRIKSIVDERVIRPLRESHAPIEELGRGSVVGMFWAFTPLVGIQMPLTTITWFALRLFRVRFNLPVAIAWVWVSNPVTMPLMYYTFYLAGIVIYEIAGLHRVALSFDVVKQVINEANNMPVMEGVWHWTDFMLQNMGWPMMIGCLVFAVPLAILSYPLTVRMVNDYRRRKAGGMGLSLSEWEDRYVFKTVAIDAPASANRENFAEKPSRDDRAKGRKKSAEKKGRRKKSAEKKATDPAEKKTVRPPKKASKKKTAGKSGRKNAKAAFKARPATA